ncbi:MAG: site-specific integrase [Bacteroidota bacterium]
MKTNNFSYLFWIRLSKTINNTAPLYLRAKFGSRRKEISLNTRVPIDLWCSDSARALGRSPEAKHINQTIYEAIDKIEQILLEFERSNRFFSLDNFKNEFINEEAPEETILGLFDYHESKMQDVLAYGTLKNYKTTKKYFADFLSAKKRSNIYVKEVDFKMCIEFESYLRKKPGLNNNGLMKHMERFKKLMNFAHSLELIDKNPTTRFKLRFKKVDMSYLTQDELNRIESLEMKSKTLQTVRDVFVFSCYTGLAYIDVKNLQNDNISKGLNGKEWIFIKRKKTGNLIRIPLLNKAKIILDKYKSHPKTEGTDLALPVFSNQKINTYLKKIAAKINLEKRLSFHTARHTFATAITLSNGVPIETVSKLLGHNKLATTQIYARVIDSKISDELEILESKLNIQNNTTKIKAN